MSKPRVYKAVESATTPFIKNNLYKLTPIDNKTLWLVEGEFTIGETTLTLGKPFWKDHLVHYK